MARIDITIRKRLKKSLRFLEQHGDVVAAYVFGSAVDGTGDKWSDIDLAVFLRGAEDWDISRRVQITVLLQKEFGDDLEPHFFSADRLDESNPASFVKYILSHGVPLNP
jgi:predicted nucleotidyltransferase